MKKIVKIQLIALMALFMVVGLSVNAEAAQTFEYKFEPNEDTNAEQLNGTANLKQMVVTFDKPISNLKAPETLKQHIFIREVGKTDKLNILETVNIEADNETLTITFENIDFIDYTTMKDFELVIGKEVLQFDQINDYVLPFTIQDVLPGFESLFIKQSAEDINNKIFVNNPPRDIMVHVPNIYIEQIETIHRYKGIIVGDNLEKELPSTHQLSNIDVLANPLVDRLKVNFGEIPNSEYYRDLGRHPDIEGFTMGQAGITAITEEDKDNATDKFELKAYNEFGRLLETRHFPLLVIDKDKNFKYNGYLSKPDSVFGTEISLYDLMSDPKKLETIMTRIPVEALDSSLGITYRNMNSSGLVVNDEKQLAMALANPNMKVIDLGTTEITGNVAVNRNVTIKGGKITGNVTLGDGTEDLIIRLDGVIVDGNLTIDVGAEGTAIVSTSTAISTEVLSGGKASVHMNNFKSSNGIEIKNETELRLVISNKTGEENELDIIYSAVAPVKIELIAGKIDFKLGNDVEIKENNKVGIIGIKENIVYPESLTNNEHFKIIEPGKEIGIPGAASEWRTFEPVVIMDRGPDGEVSFPIGLIPTENDVQLELKNWKVGKIEGKIVDEDVKFNVGTLTVTGEDIDGKSTVILEQTFDSTKYYVKIDITIGE